MAYYKMTANTLNARKGWPFAGPVDIKAAFSAASLAARSPVRRGSVLHLSSTGLYELGVGILQVMPLFLFHDSNEPDVINDGGDPATDFGAWLPLVPAGEAMALVGNMALELTSSQYVTGGEITYPPNTPLTSPCLGDGEGEDDETAGKLVEGVIYTDMIVGFVSQGLIPNGFGTGEVLAFWVHPVFPVRGE